MNPSDLPIEAVLGDVLDRLHAGNRLVLSAPPGAGKTTRLPLAMLEAGFATHGRILLLEPRRIAARGAAARMAASLGEKIGETVGLSTRLERRVSGATRIEVITDGLFTRRILASPELEGVSAVLFDEFHERSLNGDLGLALALEAQAVLRSDLRIVIMSATLDTHALCQRLGAAGVVSEGRMFEVETRYLGRGAAPVDAQVANAVRAALARDTGSILAFLPGAAEIRRTADRLADDLPETVDIAPLFGALSPAEQDAAIRPAAPGRRKVVLSTDIAESALTIEDVRIVIDAGLARVPVSDPSGWRSRLVTQRASLASVDQRRGRAGRTAPGVCYRLWSEPENRGLARQIAPEILGGDLSGLVLALADWGESEPARLQWIDPPPTGRLEAAREALKALGALDVKGQITPRGRQMAGLPLAPRLAALIAVAQTPGEKVLAAQIAAVISERGIGGSSVDIGERLARFRTEGGVRASALMRQAERWGGKGRPEGDPARIMARAWPGAIARQRDGGSGAYLLASGEAAQLPGDERLARAQWLVVAEATGQDADARITLAAPIGKEALFSLVEPETEEVAQFDAEAGRLRSARLRRIGAIELSRQPLAAPSGPTARTAIIAAIRQSGFAAIGAQESVAEHLARLALLRRVFGGHSRGAHWPELSEAELREQLEDWFPPVTGDRAPTPGQIRDALRARLGWPGIEELDRFAPMTLQLPSQRAARVDYLDDKAPLVEARVQELFGIKAHPKIARNSVPVTFALLSPARRPVAITTDLPGFWAGGYHDMAKDMRAQYPKHDWPADPASARPHQGHTRRRG